MANIITWRACMRYAAFITTRIAAGTPGMIMLGVIRGDRWNAFSVNEAFLQEIMQTIYRAARLNLTDLILCFAYIILFL